ncbi:nuclear transport factor 2 family protein [Sulfitobacter sp. S190]|uniref:nuclear transport factor 2 family protein n=1 Tax=Sulfitobacter sp. S190 TaxID=2867022 RepID=UPI0021A3882D|nr:nuclear transport factor 2 family protein [Sulfitobacter sp. S190]UWR21752.1 nuclear transport factor 2 family protein [Sulfitobacter sp. S190]
MTRFLATTALIATTLPAFATQPLPPAGAPDTAQITTLVSSIPLAVDRAAYDLAEAAFAPEIIIDYTSLWGGEPTTMTPAELMTGWRGIVPGFDATWHELGPVSVTIDGDLATATASVDGRHWIGDDIWRPIGTYHWDVAQLDGEWRVTRMVFDMTAEIGDRALAAQAMERAAAGN